MPAIRLFTGNLGSKPEGVLSHPLAAVVSGLTECFFLSFPSHLKHTEEEACLYY